MLKRFRNKRNNKASNPDKHPESLTVERRTLSVPGALFKRLGKIRTAVVHEPVRERLNDQEIEEPEPEPVLEKKSSKSHFNRLDRDNAKELILKAESTEELSPLNPKLLSEHQFSVGLFVVDSVKDGGSVVLKVCDNGDYSTLFEEYRTTKELEHENIRKCTNIPSLGRQFCVVELDYQPGKDIHQLITSGTGGDLPSVHHALGLVHPQILKRRYIAEKILYALAYLHSQGVIHNDLKPDNVLVGCSDFDNLVVGTTSVKLIDFALSFKQGETLKRSGSILYCCPEKLESGTPFSFPTDIFAFGQLFYTLFTNHQSCREEVVKGMLAKPDGTQLYREHLAIFKQKQTTIRKNQPITKWLQLRPIGSVFLRSLNLDPERRATAKKLLDCPFFACSDLSQLLANTC